MLEKAIHKAIKAHEGQNRKFTPEAFVEHPLRVMTRLSTLDGVPQYVLVAAVLHDTIEDTEVSKEELEQEFGTVVSTLVQELTNPSTGMNLPRKERKRIDREHLSQVSREARLIKLADRIDNVRGLAQGPDDFRSLYCRESRKLLKALRGTNIELEDELELAIADMESLGGKD